MDKLILSLLLLTALTLLNGCAFLDSHEYYSGESEIAETTGAVASTVYYSGGPDKFTNYLIGSMGIDIYSNISNQNHAFGPLLPIIPTFGLFDERNELINVTLLLSLSRSSSDSSKNVILTKADIRVDNKIISPATVYGPAHIYRKSKNRITMPANLIFELKETKKYVLTYNQQTKNTDNFLLILNIEDENGEIIFNDEVAYKKSESTRMRFAP